MTHRSNRYSGSVGACIALSWLAGCAAPAIPTPAGSDTSTVSNTHPALNGEYEVTFQSRWFGPMRTRMTAQLTPTGFKANTEPGVAWNLVGGLQAVLGPVLAPFIFPRGMLLVWESGVPDSQAGRDGEGWIGVSTVGPFRARTRTPVAGGPTRIQTSDGRVAAVLSVEPCDGSVATRTDYSSLMDAVERATREKLFDPRIASSPELAALFTDVRAALPHVRDDISLAFALGLAWRKHPDLPLPMVYRRPNIESGAVLERSGGALAAINVSHETDGDLAIIEAISFDDAGAVDAAFTAALGRHPRGLVLDLRNCAGFGAAALRAAAWLITEPANAGCFFGAADRAGVLSGGAPTQNRVLTRAADFDLAWCTSGDDGPANLVVDPLAIGFRGPVVVVTSGRTRSTAEVLAWLLARGGRATTVGARTAGSPMISTEHGVGEDYVVRLPELDWVSPTGQRLSEGFKPAIHAAPDAAVARARRVLRDAGAGPAPR